MAASARVAAAATGGRGRYGASMTSAPVRWERRGAVGLVTLDRPERYNAWNSDLVDELLRVLSEEAADDDVRAVCLTGSGRGFCAGADLRDVAVKVDSHGADLSLGLELGGAVVQTLRELPKPVVAAVNGPAAGAGVSLALACDLVLAARSAVFSLAFANVGLTLDCGASAFLPAAVGRARAFELALLGDAISAEQALAWGLVNAVYDDERLPTEAQALTDRLAGGPTQSYAATKSLLNATLYGVLADAIGHENRLQARLGHTADFQEGVAAFAARRPARFSGR